MPRIVTTQSAPEYLEAIIEERKKLAKKLNDEKMFVHGIFQLNLYRKYVDDFLDSLDDILDESTEEI